MIILLNFLNNMLQQIGNNNLFFKLFLYRKGENMFCKKMFAVLMFSLLFSLFTISNAQNNETEKEGTKTEVQEEQKISEEKNAAKPWNEVCPVKGGKVQKETVLVEYKDKQYGFCCPGCDSKFEKDPEKYLKNLSEDGKKFKGKK